MSTKTEFTGVVISGDQHGRQLGFATLNFNPQLWSSDWPVGVYAALVTLNSQAWLGALYYGPRFVKKETVNVLEIHVLNFNLTVYNQIAQVQLGHFVRPPMSFPATTSGAEQLQHQIQNDISQVVRAGHQTWPNIKLH